MVPNPRLADRFAGLIQTPYRSVTVPAGGTVVVWEERIPRGLVGFAVAVGNVIVNQGDSWDVRFDGNQMEGAPITREIAKPERPHRFPMEDQPWAGPIKNHIRILYTNTGASAALAEFYLGVMLYQDVVR